MIIIPWAGLVAGRCRAFWNRLLHWIQGGIENGNASRGVTFCYNRLLSGDILISLAAFLDYSSKNKTGKIYEHKISLERRSVFPAHSIERSCARDKGGCKSSSYRRQGIYQTSCRRQHR